MKAQVDVVRRDANQLGEGIVWDVRSRRVMWSDILGRCLWTLDPSAAAAQSLDLPDRLACFATLGDGRLLAGFADGLYTFDPRSGVRQLIAAIESDRPGTRLNDAKLDRQGRLVFGTMDEAEAAAGPAPIAQVWSYGGGDAPRVLFGGVQVSNSISFSPDGRTMYFADSPQRTIWAFDYDAERGDVANRRVFARTAVGYPDGSCVDADGCLWNAAWDGARVVRYAPDGSIDRIIEMPVPRTSPAAPASR